MRLLTFLTLGFVYFFFTTKSYAQKTDHYEKEWKEIDELVQKKNLPQSALAEVKKIYTSAKSKAQDAQVIKALVYMIGLQEENREENTIKGIGEFEKEITSSKHPAVSILQSILGGLYWQYFQNHRWQLYGRTNTGKFNKQDIATWTAEDFHKKISNLYLQSISRDAMLQQTSLEHFDAIITKGNVRYLRPTLYDLLAQRALDYFRNDERNIKKPAYAFEINQAEAFAPASVFTKAKFITNDSLSLHHKALLVYQHLLAFHLNDAKPDALVDADIQRIEFVYQNSIAPTKDSLYQRALQNLVSKHGSHPAAAQAWYLLAAYYKSLAAQYDPLKDTTHHYELLKAKEILERVIKDSAEKSEGWTNSYNLLKEITRPSVSFEVEKVNIPGRPFRALVKYSNLTTLNLRLLQSNEATKRLDAKRNDQKSWDSLLKIDPLKEWQQVLPATNDLQEHATEIKLDALPVGAYILLASAQPYATIEDEKKAGEIARDETWDIDLFHVSNISYVQQANQYFVLDRESGQPLANAVVKVLYRQYDYRSSRFIPKEYDSYKTDKNGFFQVERKDNRDYSFYLDIIYGNDRLSINEETYIYSYSGQERDAYKKIFYFTDRSIYRPGQTVFFKGIVVEKRSVVPGYATTIYLHDANRQKVDSIKVTTNEFGSFSGKFALPQNGLNGVFEMRDEEQRSVTHFSVEEYKRPKFYVDFEKVKDAYKVGDTITITGNAKAYAGNMVSGAKVIYRVVRQSRFLYPWLFKGWWPRTEPMEVAHGELQTNTEGKFIFTFKAIPDLKLNQKFDPVFNYEIYADVTDINGETRSGQTGIAASYKSLLLNVQMEERIAVDSFKNIFIRTENVNKEFLPAAVNVKIMRLAPENRLIRNRYWQQPDQFVLSKEEYLRNFPNDEYKDESDYRNWPEGARVFERTDTTAMNGLWAISNNQMGAGFYKIVISTKDKEGNEVKDVRFVELFDPASKQLNKPEYLWTKGSEHLVQPGEKAVVQVGSTAEKVFLIRQVERNGSKEAGNQQTVSGNYSFYFLNNEKKSFEFSIAEEDRGGYSVNFLFVKDNRFFHFNNGIVVPWTNKELQVAYATFRDKTVPGSEEKWKVRLSGYKGEKVAAEMLASMYDASLDQFRPHAWQLPGIWSSYFSRMAWNASQNFTIGRSQPVRHVYSDIKNFPKEYDRLLTVSPYNSIRYMRSARQEAETIVVGYGTQKKVSVTGAVSGMNIRGIGTIDGTNAPLYVIDGVPGGALNQLDQSDILSMDVLKDAAATAIYGAAAVNGVVIITTKKGANRPTLDIKTRKDLAETAFFFPDLHTDKDGNIEFSFTMPEALTRWKLQTFAHTKELAMGLSQKEIITQKDLMVQPNAPRFLRQGDAMEFSAKIVNLSGKELTGQAELQLMEATTNQPVDGWFQNIFPNQYFTVAAGGSEVVKFPIEVPYQFNKPLVWRVVAKAGSFSDGEEMTLPVLTNKTLVTETLPLTMRGAGTKQFTFDKLLQAGSNETLQHQSLTVEFTSNPAWYAVQALPYLMETPYECAEQTFNRYYANTLAAKIVSAAPRIRQAFDSRKTADTAALSSNLQKNQELKSVLLEETPWVLQAKTEEQQKKNIALLFDLVRMGNELKSNLQKLKEAQSENGGFVWFKGGPDDRYITQYILAGIGHLKKLDALTKDQLADLDHIISLAIPYLDRKMENDYKELVKNKAVVKKQQLSYLEAQYLYLRSFFPSQKMSQTSMKAYDYFEELAKKSWMNGNKYMQGMIALSLNRAGDQQTAKAILKSLQQTAIADEELGMYWKEAGFRMGWFWWQAPIETQSLLIEAFSEISSDPKTINNLKTWLLRNKQTTNWRTTKATADACYALLLQGSDWLSNEPQVSVQLGSTTINSSGSKTEAGTGYFKRSIEPQEIKPEMGNISVSVSPSRTSSGGTASSKQGAPGVAYGAIYWQYFEDLDKITPAATPLQLDKKLFLEKNSDRGPVLTPIEEGAVVKVGDKIKVRIELRVDRDMEYVYMKDMRAAALEPVNVLSGYKWQDGLGYYESTKDASTNFFFNYLRKGTYVFEYPLFVTHAGNYSNGITTIQCMYAPEYAAHSEGVRLKSE